MRLSDPTLLIYGSLQKAVTLLPGNVQVSNGSFGMLEWYPNLDSMIAKLEDGSGSLNLNIWDTKTADLIASFSQKQLNSW